jgi:hypothetical protein
VNQELRNELWSLISAYAANCESFPDSPRRSGRLASMKEDIDALLGCLVERGPASPEELEAAKATLDGCRRLESPPWNGAFEVVWARGNARVARGFISTDSERRSQVVIGDVTFVGRDAVAIFECGVRGLLPLDDGA